MSSITQRRGETFNSIFDAVKMKHKYMENPISSYTLEDPYDINTREKMQIFEITYKTSRSINNIDELEFQIANDYMIKKFGMSINDLKLDKLKELYPELFLI